jgi:hypothetical protein
MMKYVYLVYCCDRDEDDNLLSVHWVTAYQYEEDALAYIEQERAFDPLSAQCLYVDKVDFKV